MMDELLKNHLFATHAIAAAGSVTLSTLVSYPLDTIKSLLQVGAGSGVQLTSSQVLHRVQTLSGNSGLYSGFGWFTFGRLFGVGTRFGTYEILTAYCKDGREDNYVSSSEALFSGMAAGAMESLITSPFEIIKLRTQVTSASLLPSTINKNKALTPTAARLLPGYTPDIKSLNQSVGLLKTLTSKHPNITGAIQNYPWMMTGSGKPPSIIAVNSPSKIISLEGWGALWRGLRSGVARDSVFGGVFFCSWQFLHQTMLDWKAAGMNPEPRYNDEIGPLSPLGVSVAAGISGSIAAVASHGFDTAKSRSQCIVLPKYTAMERKMLKWKRPGKRFERLTGIHPRDRNLLLRGIWLRMARSGLASFMIVSTYFVTVDCLVPK